MEYLLQQLIIGISVGSIYALIALGYTMVYGIIKLINFAHGDVFMVGAFVGFFAVTSFQLPFYVAIILSMAICALLGVTIERFAYRPLRNQTRIAVLTTAIGVSLLLENGGIYVWGAAPKTFPAERTVYDFYGLTINNQQIAILLVATLLMIMLQFIVHKTKVGKAMRAVSFDMDAAKLMGINVNQTISYTFAIGSALAGAGGVVFGMYYTKIDPLMGLLPGLKAFVAAVLGGIGNIPGAFIGGLLLGVIETGVSAYGSSLWRDGAAFIILILILLIKPSGLFGKNVREKV